MIGAKVGPLREGRAFYRDGDRYGFLDAEGRVAIAARFEEGANFHEGRALAKVGGLYGYIDTDGRDVVRPTYVHASQFFEGRALVMTPSREPLVIGLDGETLLRVESRIDDASWFVSEGCVRIRRAGGVGFLDLDGRERVPCIYEEAEAYFAMGLVRVKRGGRWGFASTDGVEVIECAFTGAENFMPEGFARVARGAGWGLVDRTGRVVVPCRYLDVGRAYEGRVRVCLPPTRDADEWYNRNGYCDLEGTEVVACVYELAGDFVDGRAEVQEKRADGTTRTFRIDRDGREVLGA